MKVLRVVFDCNTLLQALASPGGPAARCVQLAVDGEVTLFASPVILGELREVMARPTVARKLRITPERAKPFLETLEAAATLLREVPETFTYERDPDDAHYVNLALAADARLIVSRDRDLLDLMNDAIAASIDFQTRFPTLRILTPVEFLIEVRGE
jgi:putative PIN family toxin of toxin-antitoxin system